MSNQNLSESDATETVSPSQGNKLKNWLQTIFGGSQVNTPRFPETDASILADFFADENLELSIFDNPKYVKIRNIFIDTNTKIASSAAVERLFSLAKSYWTYERTNLNDEIINQMIFLKSNKELKYFFGTTNLNISFFSVFCFYYKLDVA